MTTADPAPLDDVTERFCQEYVKDFKGGAAARRAGISNPATSRSWACRALDRPEVAARVEQLKAEHLREVNVEAKDVLHRLASIAMTDIAELVEYRRCCCRNCWGLGFRYQHTDGALRAARMRHEAARRKAATDGRDLVEEPTEFDEEGGGGYNATNDPHPDCPECHGEGIGVPFLKDTRDLPPGAAAAYAGVKVTKDGIELKTHDSMRALELIGKHLGMFKDQVEHSGHITVQQLAHRMRNRAPLA